MQLWDETCLVGFCFIEASPVVGDAAFGLHGSRKRSRWDSTTPPIAQPAIGAETPMTSMLMSGDWVKALSLEMGNGKKKQTLE